MVDMAPAAVTQLSSDGTREGELLNRNGCRQMRRTKKICQGHRRRHRKLADAVIPCIRQCQQEFRHTRRCVRGRAGLQRRGSEPGRQSPTQALEQAGYSKSGSNNNALLISQCMKYTCKFTAHTRLLQSRNGAQLEAKQSGQLP